MHSAPAVSFPVGRSRFHGWLVSLAGLGGAVAGLLWHYQTSPAGWRPWLFFGTLLGACVVAAYAWRRSPRGSLCWDGLAWSWTTVDGSARGVLAVHFDLQFCMVLSFRPDRGALIWLWAQRELDVALWTALRRAVFSRGGARQPKDTSVDGHGAFR